MESVPEGGIRRRKTLFLPNMSVKIMDVDTVKLTLIEKILHTEREDILEQVRVILESAIYPERCSENNLGSASG